jgi:hypothetical protein
MNVHQPLVNARQRIIGIYNISRGGWDLGGMGFSQNGALEK